MNELVKKLQYYIIQELTRVRGNQCTLDSSEDDMFHFYSGCAHELTNLLDELCTLEGRRLESEKKEVK